ncbi:hypothetical protein DFH07DRAFT_782528 [Mycena maculata]|uniref:Uncharacterized protein n=1 Tax=Mycena maculata TaxID=230809 RepID=A0AAD7MQC8_9AGAR|nr:hypothetical protein DFH07DRAFT_782528 [Mycena maculata]
MTLANMRFTWVSYIICSSAPRMSTRSAIFVLETSTLIAKRSDLDFGLISEGVLVDTLYILLLFASLYGGTIDASDVAYLRTKEFPLRPLHEVSVIFRPPLRSQKGPSSACIANGTSYFSCSDDPTISNAVEIVTQPIPERGPAAPRIFTKWIFERVPSSFDDFIEHAFSDGVRSLPLAFLAGVRSSISSLEPQIPPAAADATLDTQQRPHISVPKRTECYPPPQTYIRTRAPSPARSTPSNAAQGTHRTPTDTISFDARPPTHPT